MKNPPSQKTSPWAKLLAQFQRQPSSGRYMPEVDGLRFVAIMAVVLYHAHTFFFENPIPKSISWQPSFEWLNFAIGHGWFGVQVFFVISGFVLALPFVKHHSRGARAVDLKNYYTRRVVRIGVPYYLALSLGLLTNVLGDMNLWEGLQRYGAGLLYSHGLLYNGQLNPILFVSWTLEIEVQFYLLAPLLCMVFRFRQQWLRTLALLAGIWGIQTLSGHLNLHFTSPLWSHSIIGQLQFFLAGILLGDIYINQWQDRPASCRAKLVWDALGVLAWLSIPFALNLSGSHAWLAILLFLAFSCVLRGSLLKRALSLPLVTSIGGMCYSVYLFHGAVLYAGFYNFILPVFSVEKGNWPFNLIPLTIITVLSVASCGLAYKWVEKPTMNWGKKKPVKGQE